MKTGRVIIARHLGVHCVTTSSGCVPMIAFANVTKMENTMINDSIKGDELIKEFTSKFPFLVTIDDTMRYILFLQDEYTLLWKKLNEQQEDN